MQFKRLSEYFGRIESTSARNTKTEILTEILKEAEPSEVDKLVYLSLGGLRPAFDRLEFDMGEALILRAIGATTKQYQEIGDLGELVAKLKSQSSDHSPRIAQGSELGVSEVYGELEKIARDSGAGSQERKVRKLAQLIKNSDAQSAKYIVRMVAGKLRLGFSDKTVIDALSYMEKGTKEYSDLLDRAYQVRPDTGVLAKAVKEMGVVKAVETMEVEMGTPIVPALAQRLKTAKEMIGKMGRVYCEPKYDGTRVQIHYSRNGRKGSEVGAKVSQESLFESQSSDHSPKIAQGSELKTHWVRTFTRNLDESSAMFPELQNIANQIKADEVILDSEAVGYDPKTGHLVPFQLTITRKRKHGIEESASSVPLRFFVFDIMYKDGQSLIHLPLSERRKILAETVVSNRKSQGSELGSRKFGTKGEGSELGSRKFGTKGEGSELGARKFGTISGPEGSELGEGTLVVDEYIETDDPDVLRAYHGKQLAEGLEGALVKQVSGQYMPGRTGFNWVKFKEAEDSRAKLSDTIDAVIMGYYTGKGKRQKFGVGAFLVGIKGIKPLDHLTNEPLEEKILTIAKIGTGISDEQFGELKTRLDHCAINPQNRKSSEHSPKIAQGSELEGQKPELYNVPKILEPDVWVEPEIIVEVAADEITVSPTHSAGYALRFPRLVKFRDDKSVEQITTMDEIKTMIGI